jgi:hypothetical protein
MTGTDWDSPIIEQKVSSVHKRKAIYEGEDSRWEKKSRILRSIVRNMENGDKSEKDNMTIDTGGGRNAKVTSKAWQVLHHTAIKQQC